MRKARTPHTQSPRGDTRGHRFSPHQGATPIDPAQVGSRVVGARLVTLARLAAAMHEAHDSAGRAHPEATR